MAGSKSQKGLYRGGYFPQTENSSGPERDPAIRQNSNRRRAQIRAPSRIHHPLSLRERRGKGRSTLRADKAGGHKGVLGAYR